MPRGRWGRKGLLWHSAVGKGHYRDRIGSDQISPTAFLIWSRQRLIWCSLELLTISSQLRWCSRSLHPCFSCEVVQQDETAIHPYRGVSLSSFIRDSLALFLLKTSWWVDWKSSCNCLDIVLNSSSLLLVRNKWNWIIFAACLNKSIPVLL